MNKDIGAQVNDPVAQARYLASLLKQFPQLAQIQDVLKLFPCNLTALGKLGATFPNQPYSDSVQQNTSGLTQILQNLTTHLTPEMLKAISTNTAGSQNPDAVKILQSNLPSPDEIPALKALAECLLSFAMSQSTAAGDLRQGEHIQIFKDMLAEPDAFHPDRYVMTPRLISPSPDAELSNFPRTLRLEWGTVAGAVEYRVEVQYCEQQFCIGGGLPLVSATTREPTYELTFVGKQSGRWRAASVDTHGTISAWSPWSVFTYLV